MAVPERLNIGRLVAAIGAALLLASLFMDWYEPGFSAWTVFELVDLILAVIAAAALIAVVQELVRGLGPRLDIERLLPALGATALLLVVVSIVNNPPAVTGRGEEAGAWVALAGALLLAAGAVLASRRISVQITSSARPPTHEEPAPPRPPTGPATDPVGSETETSPVNPVRRP